MALPIQTDPVQAVLRGQEYWRLKQELLSAGDIFELNESTRAVYIGPESDVSEVRLAYLDPDAPNGMQTAIVSPNGPFVGRFDAFNSQKVASTGLPGKILITPADFIDPTYMRPVANPDLVPTRSYLVRPIIDLICSFNPVDVPDVRADKTHRFPFVPFNEPVDPTPNGQTDIIIPAYGRRLISIFAVLPIAGITVDLSFMSVVLQPGSSSSPFASTPRLIGFASIFGASIVRTFPFVIRASSDIEVYSDGVNPNIAELPISGPIGMFDYLIINVAASGGMTPGAPHSIELYVKLSDRED